jgi:ferredoxin/flavodoxin---NADP+ reductase
VSASAPPPPSSRLPGELPPDKYSRERVTWIEAVNDHLFRFRTTRYRGFRFTPGQFARLGVYRDDGPAGPRHVWRAYSIASSSYEDFLEFYSIVVPQGEFTTQLAALQVGDEILIEKTNYGFLTTDRFPAGKQLWLLSSGTGLAPFMAILQDLDIWATYEDIVVVHSVRRPDELAYRQEILVLAQQAGPIPEAPGAVARLHYVPIVTREPQAGLLADRIPVAIANGRLEQAAGLALAPATGRTMICGNPDMVEDVRRALHARGFTVSRRSHPGNMAVENYW